MARAQKRQSPPGETLRGVRRSAAGAFACWRAAAGVLLREVQAAGQAPAQQTDRTQPWGVLPGLRVAIPVNSPFYRDDRRWGMYPGLSITPVYCT